MNTWKEEKFDGSTILWLYLISRVVMYSKVVQQNQEAHAPDSC
jgi:hypothetical protein